MNQRQINISIMVAVVLIAVATTFIGLAEAKTANFSEVYTEIYLYSEERLKVFNNQAVPHSITGINGTFDSGIIYPNGMTDMGFYTDGDFAFYDSNNPSLTGIIHVRTSEPPLPSLSAPSQVEAGNSFTITGENISTSKQITLLIVKPDGSEYTTLTVFPTSTGQISIPMTTSRTDQNGVYSIYDNANTDTTTSFIINGGVTAENPLETAPITNSTSTNSTTTEPAPTPTSDGSSSTTTTTTEPIDADKQALIDWLKQMISYYQQLLAIVEAS